MADGSGNNLKGLRRAKDFIRWAARRQKGYFGLFPTNLLLYMTYRCTSACRTCGMWRRPKVGEELTANQWLEIARQFEGRDIRYAELFGGDALLRPDTLFVLGKALKDQCIPKVDLTTNCNLMTPKVAAELVRAGISPIVASCDGPGEVHDRVRGRAGSFENVRRGVAMLREARGAGKTPEIILNCTVSRHNIDAFEKVFDLALEWGADKLACEYVGEFPSDVLDRSCFAGVRPEPYFERRAGQESLLLDPDQARTLKRKIRALKERAKREGVELLTYNIDTLTVRQLVAGTVPKTHCHVIRTWVTVDPLGNVLPCPFFHRYSIGNLAEKALAEIWGNRLHRDFIRAADAGRMEMCRHCILSVERNANLWALMKRTYLRLTRRGLDES